VTKIEPIWTQNQN